MMEDLPTSRSPNAISTMMEKLSKGQYSTVTRKERNGFRPSRWVRAGSHMHDAAANFHIYFNADRGQMNITYDE